jgi:hypothetical protein
MLTPTNRHNSRPSSQIEPAIFEIGSSTSASVLLLSGEHDSVGFSSSPRSLLPFDERARYTFASSSLPEPVAQNTPCLHKDALSPRPSWKAVPRRYCPAWVPKLLHHAFKLRLRLTIAGLHSRRPADFAWSHFFPRSVGFRPTASSASGALIIAPSMLCQRQAIPTISSYSASPLRQRRTKTPSRFHFKKYLWTELALPNTSLGSAFHWHPVRRTYTMAAKTLRGGMGFRPPPGRRRYFFLFRRSRDGINGSIRSHSWSDTVQDLIALMANIYHESVSRSIFIYG